MSRVVPNALLLLLLIFLLPIYQANPTTEVLALTVALLAAALFLGYTNQPRGTEMLLAMTIVVSFIGVAFLGRTLIGSANGSYCFLVLWSLALVGILAVFWRRAVVVERGQILVINQLPENRTLIWQEGLHRPINPIFERYVAALPAYELIIEALYEDLNTESLFNIDRLEVVVRYQVDEPREVVFCLPNREQIRDALIRERPEPETTGENVAFWTELIRRAMLLEVEQTIRSVVASAGGPTDVARKREHFARLTRDRLQSAVERWGIRVLDLHFSDVVVASERVRAANREVIIERERQDAQRSAELRAHEVRLIGEAHAHATARMVQELVQTLKAQGTPLTVEEIERIVITAMQRVSDQQQLSSFFRDVTQNAAPSPPPPSPSSPSSTGTTTNLPDSQLRRPI